MFLDALVKRPAVPADLPLLVLDRIGPFRKKVGVFCRCGIVNAPGLGQGHKYNAVGFVGPGDLGASVNLLQHDGLGPLQRLPAQQMIDRTGKGNARSLRLRAKDKAAIAMLFDVGRGLGHADAGPVFCDPEHCPPPKKIA